jgi:hypothetical protein
MKGENATFYGRYARFLRSLPTICPPLAPTIIGISSLLLLFALGIRWPALPLGIGLLALGPQWDSCVFGLMDFLVICLVILAGVSGVLRAVAG